MVSVVGCMSGGMHEGRGECGVGYLRGGVHEGLDT